MENVWQRMTSSSAPSLILDAERSTLFSSSFAQLKPLCYFASLSKKKPHSIAIFLHKMRLPFRLTVEKTIICHLVSQYTNRRARKLGKKINFRLMLMHSNVLGPLYLV